MHINFTRSFPVIYRNINSDQGFCLIFLKTVMTCVLHTQSYTFFLFFLGGCCTSTSQPPSLLELCPSGSLSFFVFFVVHIYLFLHLFIFVDSFSFIPSKIN